MQTEILAPAALLIVWSLIVLSWMAFTRMPAMAKAGINLKDRVGGRGQDLDGVIPPKVSWKAHNYTHLMEQPTLFYACCLILALVGYPASVLVAAWIYVGLRIVHSLWQALVNTIPVRMTLFMASTFCLVFMAINALIAAI